MITDTHISINDGSNNTSFLDYDTYRIDLSLASSYSFPVVINKYPYTKLKMISNAESGQPLNTILQKVFNHRNLILHTQGKGVLGCKELEVLDMANGTRNITKNILYSNAGRNHFVYPAETKTYGITSNGDVLLSETYNSVSIKETINNVPKIFFPVTTSSYTKSWDLDGTYKGIQLVKQDILNVDEYGNLLMKEVLHDEYKTTPDGTEWNWQTQYWTFYNHVTDNGKWHSRLASTTVKAKSYELNNQWKFESTENEYYNNGLLMSTKSIAGYNQFNSPLVKKENFEYDIYGNIKKKTLSAPNNAQLASRITEFEYGSIYESRLLTMQKIKGTSGSSSDDCTVYEYYPDKGLLKEKKELYNISTSTSPVVTHYEYDLFGRLLKTINPDQT